MSNNGGYDPKTATFAQKVAFYEKFSGAKKDQEKNMGGKKAGGTKLPCQQKGRATIYVSDSEGKGVAKVSAELSGQKAQETKSPDGAAPFPDLDPGSYTAQITLGDLSQRYCIVTSDNGPKEVKAGGSKEFNFKVERLPILRIKVVKRGDHSKVFENAAVKIESGPQLTGESKTTTKVPGPMADFGRTKTGDYTVKVTLKEADKKNFFAPDNAVPIKLKPGDEEPKLIEVDTINIVTPKIEMEYKVVLLDRNLAKIQKDNKEKDEDLIYANATYIVVYASQTNQNRPYKKTGKLKFSPANVEVYRDEQCKTKLEGDLASGIELTNEQITDPKKLKIYLRGKTAGKFKVSLELEDPADKALKLDKNTASEDMGVVELKMIPHQHDATELAKIEVDPDTDPIDTYYTNLKNKVLPDQKEMTDEDKVKVGRLLHAQKDGNFGLAKLLCKKLDGSQWPTETDNYELVINETNNSGAVEVCDAEWDGEVKHYPIKIKVSKLKAADQTFWIQGKTATKEWRDVRLDLGLDRPEGGLEKKTKRNGDWARYTVVEIKEIKVNYKAEAGKAVAWDETNQRFYINLGASWDDTNKKFTTDASTDENGRKITIGAQLSERLKGIKIYFMLAPDKNNRKAANWGKDMPATWKWDEITWDVKHKDKADPKDLLHLSATTDANKTDANGYAKVELVLSRFGGDKFQPACYIDQDPHLAKYVDGHTDLEKKKPVLAAKHIQVWRKFWYQLIKVEGVNNPGAAGAVNKWEAVKTNMVVATDVSITKVAVGNMTNRAIWEEYMIRVGGGDDDALVISDLNKADFFDDSEFEDLKPEKDKPVKVPIIICDAQWDSDTDSGAQSSDWEESTDFPIELGMDKLILDPPLQGGNLFVSGTWDSVEFDSVNGTLKNPKNGNLANGDLRVSKTRNSLRKVTVKLPAGVGGAAPDVYVRINNLIVKGAKGPYLGEYSKATQRILCVYESATAEQRADFQNTIAHEVGHGFRQTATGGSSGAPAHPKHYYKQGDHCNYDTNKCLMYESGPITGTLGEFCKECHPYVLFEDMSKLKS